MAVIPAYDLDELIALLAVIERGSISRAAAELHLTQPAVSQKIRALEAALGAPLLHRTSRGVQPTVAGETVRRAVPPLLAALRGMEQDVRRALEPGADHVVLGSSDTAALYLLPRAVRRFRKRFPGSPLAIVNRESRELLRQCADGTLDLALVSLPHAPPSHLAAQVLLRAPLVVAGARRHPLLASGGVSRAALAREPLVLLARGTATRALIDRYFEPVADTLHVAMESGNLEVLKSYAADGLGLTLLPEWAVAPPDRGRLALARARPEPPRLPLALVHSAAREPSPTARALREILLSELAARN